MWNWPWIQIILLTNIKNHQTLISITSNQRVWITINHDKYQWALHPSLRIVGRFEPNHLPGPGRAPRNALQRSSPQRGVRRGDFWGLCWGCFDGLCGGSEPIGWRSFIHSGRLTWKWKIHHVFLMLCKRVYLSEERFSTSRLVSQRVATNWRGNCSWPASSMNEKHLTWFFAHIKLAITDTPVKHPECLFVPNGLHMAIEGVLIIEIIKLACYGFFQLRTTDVHITITRNYFPHWSEGKYCLYQS